MGLSAGITRRINLFYALDQLFRLAGALRSRYSLLLTHSHFNCLCLCRLLADIILGHNE
jgi:hypothetical protein